MKLYLNETSPFSRLVVAIALLTQQKEVTLAWVDPWVNNEDFFKVNPFSTIPTLELTDHTVITESLCICEYLLNTSAEHVPVSNSAQLPLLGFAKTLMELAYRTTALNRFHGAESELVTRGEASLKRALHALETKVAKDSTWDFSGNDYPALCMMVALEYVQFRHQALFESVNPHHIKAKMQQSQHHAVLSRVSVEKLSLHPSFDTLTC